VPVALVVEEFAAAGQDKPAPLEALVERAALPQPPPLHHVLRRKHVHLHKKNEKLKLTKQLKNEKAKKMKAKTKAKAKRVTSMKGG
jgi:hypothetical protein